MPAPVTPSVATRTRWCGALAAVVVATGLTITAVPPAHAEANSAPDIIPALQTWVGGEGAFTIEPSSRIVADAELEGVAEQLAADLAAVMGVSAPVVIDADAEPSDVVLTLDADLEHGPGGVRFEEEGYRLAVTPDSLEISAPTSNGAFYGTRTVLQALMQSTGRDTVPVGESFDWPSHAVRGFMLDVGRRFFTPEFVRDYITMMSWYKLNEFQIHLNDNEISRPAGGWIDAYDGFRLRSENPAFAGLASEDGAYDREDWQSFEDTAAAHAVQIIPEIDVPAHSRSFIRWKPELGFNAGDSDHLDLSKPATTPTIKAVFDEFVPWFEGSDVHFGADEYPRDQADAYRTFFNEMAGHIRSLGKHPRAWGSMTVMHGSAAGYDRDVTINSWNNGWYGMASALADGYDFINTNDGDLYVVPFANYYHPVRELLPRSRPQQSGAVRLLAAEPARLHRPGAGRHARRRHVRGLERPRARGLHRARRARARAGLLPGHRTEDVELHDAGVVVRRLHRRSERGRPRTGPGAHRAGQRRARARRAELGSGGHGLGEQ
jgi:hypothetical protein